MLLPLHLRVEKYLVWRRCLNELLIYECQTVNLREAIAVIGSRYEHHRWHCYTTTTYVMARMLANQEEICYDQDISQSEGWKVINAKKVLIIERNTW